MAIRSDADRELPVREPDFAGVLRAPLTTLIWMPVLAFEVPGGLWLLAKGVP